MLINSSTLNQSKLAKFCVDCVNFYNTVNEVAGRIKRIMYLNNQALWYMDDAGRQHLADLVEQHFTVIQRALRANDYRSAFTIGVDVMACLVLLFCANPIEP